jgi:RNA polymerase sigma-70 factor (ECF subfamily)
MIAEELVNDVFMKVYQTINKFDESKASFKTWVYNIATYAAIDHLRKKKLATKSMFDSFENNDGEVIAIDFEDSQADPLEQMITNESQEEIAEGIRTLPKQQAEMLKQYAVGFSYEEIAAELGIPLGTVKGAMHLARVKMKAYFQKEEPVLA